MRSMRTIAAPTSLKNVLSAAAAAEALAEGLSAGGAEATAFRSETGERGRSNCSAARLGTWRCLRHSAGACARDGPCVKTEPLWSSRPRRSASRPFRGSIRCGPRRAGSGS